MDRERLRGFALAAAIALIAVACDTGDGAGHNETPNARTSSNAVRDPFVSLDLRAGAEPGRDLFEVDAAHGEYWRTFTLDLFDGESWTSTNPSGTEEGVHLAPRRSCYGPAALRLPMPRL